MKEVGGVSNYLRENIQRIVGLWELRVRQEVDSARAQDRVILRDEIPEFLLHLSEGLSKSQHRELEEEVPRNPKSESVAREHGAQRAATGSYSLDEAILEYHYLRLVLFQVLEERSPIEPVEREIIVSTIETAVQKMASEFAKSVLEARDLFVLTLVHDLRGPLNNMSMALQALEAGVEPEVSDKARRAMQAGLVRLDRMTTDLLDAWKVAAGGTLLLVFEKLALEELVHATVDELRFEDKIVIKSSSLAAGYWSRDGLRRVMENLISNAVKYGAPHAPITITIDESESAVFLSVHNQGEPISTADKTAIFETFFQSRSGPFKGWGIGLALVKGIVFAHGGNIRVESAPKEGTTFIIELPKNSVL